MTRSEAARLLGVSENAEPAAVRGAFRSLARRAHPDASDGGNPALLAAAKDARDILLGTLTPDPEPHAMVPPVPGGSTAQAGSAGPYRPMYPSPSDLSASDRVQTDQRWEPVMRERRLGRFLVFVAFLVMLVVGAVLAVLLFFANTAQDLAPYVGGDLNRIPADGDDSDPSEPTPRDDGTECVIVTLVPAEVLGVDCAEPDAQRVVAVFGGRVDCPLALNALFVAGQTWCLQPADQVSDSIIAPEAGG